MNGYSVKVIEIIKMLYVKNDIKKADIMIDQLEDEVDKGYAQVFKTFND